MQSIKLIVTLLARTLFSQGNKFVNISENEVIAKISEFTVILTRRDTDRFIFHYCFVYGVLNQFYHYIGVYQFKTATNQ